MYSTSYQRLVLPLKDFVRGTSTIRCLQTLRRTQYLDAEGIRRLQGRRLRRIINHAYRKVPYYRRLFRKLNLRPEDVTDVEDLAKIPPLPRRELRDNFGELYARGYPNRYTWLDASSGSTGEPIRFYKTRRERSWELAAEMRAHDWFGAIPGERYALVFPERIFPRVEDRMRVALDRLASRCRFLNGLNLSEERMTKFAEGLVRFRPAYVVGSPGALSVFVEHVRGKEIPLRVDRVVTSFERLFPFQRRLMEDVLRAEVYDFYGSREVGSMAAECPHHSGYVCSAENLHLEVVRDGEPCAQGEMGEILVTSFLNYAMPLIRYRIGDTGVLSSERCDSRGLPLFRSIQGRVIGMLVSSEGHLVSTVLSMDALPVRQFQVLQEESLDVTVRVIPDAGYSREDDARVMGSVRRRLGDVKVRIEHVSEIPVTRSGKHQYVFSRAAERLVSSATVS